MNDSLLWYATRGAGAVSLALLTVVVGFGILGVRRFEARGWPRFLTTGLHNNLALLATALVLVHVVIAAVDPFTSLGINAALVPFSSYYRTFWLGLGTIAFELLIAVIVTSLLRGVIGLRPWRWVHWLAYGCWPLAFIHGIGTGTDAGTAWMRSIDVVCGTAVVVAVGWRLLSVPADPLSGERARFRSRVSRGSAR